jgi:hypothetical protein
MDKFTYTANEMNAERVMQTVGSIGMPLMFRFLPHAATLKRQSLAASITR